MILSAAFRATQRMKYWEKAHEYSNQVATRRIFTPNCGALYYPKALGLAKYGTSIKMVKFIRYTWKLAP
jgi:hypothetical protein